jgi:predicted restriction endonuclease
MNSAYEAELQRREKLFVELEKRKDDNGNVAASDLQELRIFRGGRGIWWDKNITGGYFSPGATVSLLHTGRHYDDDLEDEFAFYHYPTTKQPTHDKNDIESTRLVMEKELPLFYIIERGNKREVRKAYVEMDDGKDAFLIRFGSTPKPFKGHTLEQVISEPFPEMAKQIRRTGTHKVRANQKAFSMAARKFHGTTCAFCGLNVPLLLDAAHIIPDEKDGPNDPRNSLILCATHHRAFDEGLVFIHPETLALVQGVDHISLENAGIRVASLAHLTNKPHPQPLVWRWENPAPYRGKK